MLAPAVCWFFLFVHFSLFFVLGKVLLIHILAILSFTYIDQCFTQRRSYITDLTLDIMDSFLFSLTIINDKL